MSLPRRLSEPGPIIEYIAELQKIKPAVARAAVLDIRNCLETQEGSMLLDLLEKATLHRSIPIASDPRALDANNAQSFIALDLRRILSDEFDEHPKPSPSRVGQFRSNRRNTGT